MLSSDFQGAGVSVQAGIPDFRSPDGLFKSLKRDNPREALASGKDLFDASVFNSEHTTALFCQMIAQLWTLSQAAEPTSFHNVLRALDDRGKLLRVYTQNIDALEEKCGLSFGVPQFEDKRCKGRSKATTSAADCVIKEPPPSDASKLPCPPGDSPRCIPLHGTLQSMHCQTCNCSYALEHYLDSLTLGQPPQCPECTTMEETRQLIGKRPRGIGKLRPSVVLYNEAHKNGEGVGEVVQKDLIGSSKGKGRSGADLLLVVGTSLRVAGTKRMVREFAKAVRSRGVGSSHRSVSPGSSPRPSPTTDEEPAMKAIYLNLDFPVPVREWEGVFDAWIQGDAQIFADMLQEEIEREARARELALERKRRREEEATSMDKPCILKGQSTVNLDAKSPKRKIATPSTPPSKKRKTSYPITPPRTNSPKPKVMLRIPARSPQKSSTAEAAVSPPPTSYSRTHFGGRLPITPVKSPPPLSKDIGPLQSTSHYTHPGSPSRESSLMYSDDEEEPDAHYVQEILRPVHLGLYGVATPA
ncbi:hypothetical protein H0H93_009173 [Arthromyces matolae]|nr:hypothetical protein H0H93_009173 [Arthromyces matolae]